MRRRLEALERRLEGEERREDSQSDGLRYLLTARQHRERGDDAAALRAYELALPFFPGQTKLIGKIERLRSRLGLPPADITCQEQPNAPTAAQHRKPRSKSMARLQVYGDEENATTQAFLMDHTISARGAGFINC